jgi:hypothetical protein
MNNATAKPAQKTARKVPAVTAITPMVTPITTDGAVLQRKACACGGGCPRCRDKPALQTKLALSQPHDALEQEADRIADRIVSIAPPGRGDEVPRTSRAPPAISRATASPTPSPPVVASVHEGLHSPGQPLDRATRDYFESRFGSDLGTVRVHTDARAAQSAYALQASAYTVGRDVVFGRGQYAPTTMPGRHLLAHELTHVLQQSAAGAQPRLQRRVDPTHVHCTPNQNDAPGDPVAALESMDDYARDLALGSSGVLFLAAMRAVSGSALTEVLDAYHRRFGAPQAVSGGFRDRFSGTVYTTVDEAETAELHALSGRFQSVGEYLAGIIRYYCRAFGVPFTAPPCGPATCHSGDANAYSCPVGNSRMISLCPDFWTVNVFPSGGALNILHEVMHMRFHMRRHPSTTTAQRGRNPECYASFVADLYGLPVAGAHCDPVAGAP